MVQGGADQRKEGAAGGRIGRVPFGMPLHTQHLAAAGARRHRLDQAILCRDRLDREAAAQPVDALLMHRIDADAAGAGRTGKPAIGGQLHVMAVVEQRIVIALPRATMVAAVAARSLPVIFRSFSILSEIPRMIAASGHQSSHLGPRRQFRSRWAEARRSASLPDRRRPRSRRAQPQFSPSSRHPSLRK